MAGGCYDRRRLSELLQEQQEPFLLLLPLHGHGSGEAPCCSALGRAARKALRRWDGLVVPGYGCFPCGRREKFRRLPRDDDDGGHCDDDDVTELGGGDGSPQQLSPVSVLDVLQYDSDSDEEPSSAPALSSWEEEDDDEKESTASGSSSPPVEQDDGLTGAKTRAREAMAALVELELSSGSTAREWRRLWEEEDEAETEAEEASRVAESIEAMIFEEIRAEAVRDMIEFRL